MVREIIVSTVGRLIGGARCPAYYTRTDSFSALAVL